MFFAFALAPAQTAALHTLTHGDHVCPRCGLRLAPRTSHPPAGGAVTRVLRAAGPCPKMPPQPPNQALVAARRQTLTCRAPAYFCCAAYAYPFMRLDEHGDQGLACATSGACRARAHALERGLARVDQEAGTCWHPLAGRNLGPNPGQAQDPGDQKAAAPARGAVNGRHHHRFAYHWFWTRATRSGGHRAGPAVGADFVRLMARHRRLPCFDPQFVK